MMQKITSLTYRLVFIINLLSLTPIFLAQNNVAMKTNALPQTLNYYGYWDCLEFFQDQTNSINGLDTMFSNSGVVSNYRKFTETVDATSSSKKLLINLTEFFFSDNNNNGRPDIEDINSYVPFDSNTFNLSDTNYSNSVLGYIIEEPMAHVNNEIFYDNYPKETMDYDNLKFVVSGNFCGSDSLDDVALIYARADGGMTIKIMEANGQSFDDLSTIISFSNTSYLINSVKFVVAGDYNNDNHDDLAIFYQYPEKFRIHIFNSNGTTLESSYYSYISKDSSEYKFSNVKFVTSGNYDGNNGDDFAMFYRDNDSSRIDLITSKNNLDKGWISQANLNQWDINYIRLITSGNFDGENGTDEIAVLYDYPASSLSKIEVFRGTPSNAPTKFPGWETWFSANYDSVDFNYVKAFLNTDFNYDGTDDVVLLYDTPISNNAYEGYQRVMRYLSNPNNQTVSTRFQYAGIGRRDYSHIQASPSYGCNHLTFNHLSFAVAGNFYNNLHVNDKNNTLSDYYWIKKNSSTGIGDILYFFNNSNVVCDATMPTISFGNKEQLKNIYQKTKDAFGSTSIVAILYMESSTFIPDIFCTSYDWIGTDPYPYTNASNSDSSKVRIENAVNNILNNTPPQNSVFLVGQSVESTSNNALSLRYPTEMETLHYYETARSNSRIKALYWWTYTNAYPSYNGASFNNVEANSILQEHIAIGDSISNSLPSKNTLTHSLIQPLYTFDLSENYPNPFNPTTTIQYSIPEETMVKLRVFDILGREVKTLVNEVKSPGTYKAQFNGNRLASGIYFYTLTAGKFSETKKFVLMK